MGLFMTDMVIGSFSLNKCMYQIQGVMMDLYGTYDGILGLNFFAQHGLLTDTNSLAYLLEAGGTDLSALGLQKEDMSNLKFTSAMANHTEIHPTTLQNAMAVDSHSLAEVLHHLTMMFSVMTLEMCRTFPLYPKQNQVFISKSILNRVLLLTTCLPITYLKLCFLVSIRCC